MRIGAEAILAVIVAPIVIWFLGFVISSYQVQANVENQQQDIKEIKQDVKEIKTFLMERR